MRFIILLLIALNLLNAGDKIALLIGNSDYSFQPLDNPLNDVDGIYKTLIEIGFKKSNIKVLKNASKIKMETELANFSQRATSAEIALVYFSGHGMQVNNTNYMFPARTTATKPIHLRTLVDLDYFIESASAAKYGIILVDACRNNPLVKYFQNGKHKGSSAKKGLGQVTPKVGQVVIGFATSAGDTADDGNGNMSPYARALSVRLKEPNKDITKVLGLVALDVSAKYEQNPIIRTNLAYDVCLSGGCTKEKSHIKEFFQNEPKVKKDSDEIILIHGLEYQNERFNSFLWSNNRQYKMLEDAEKYCKDLDLDGKGWRLPTHLELYGVGGDSSLVESDSDFYMSSRGCPNSKKYGDYACWVDEKFIEKIYEFKINDLWCNSTKGTKEKSIFILSESEGSPTEYYGKKKFDNLEAYTLCVRGKFESVNNSLILQNK
jgi:hypothetical protein